MTEPVGVAGLGRMGAPMARAMRRAGFDVIGFDVRPREEFGDLVDVFVEDAGDFAARARTVFSVVRDIDQTEALLFEEQRILEGGLQTLIICSTLSPRYLADLKARVPAHITLLDAPMSGAAIAAEEARLSFMLGGADADLDLIQPLLSAMGTAFHRMGPFGAGMTAKVLNNLVAASSTAATRTALAWADGVGVEREALLDLMADSSGQTWFGSNFDQIEFSRDGLAPDNTIAIIAKDVASAIDAAPEGADTDLAEAIIRTIKGLRPI